MLQHRGANSWSLKTLPDPGDQLQRGGLHLQQQQGVPLLLQNNCRKQTIQVGCLEKFYCHWQLLTAAVEVSKMFFFEKV